MDYRSYRREAIGLDVGVGALHDGSVPESLVQSIWRHQRIHRAKARTVDGTPITILHPGFLNLEAGPDFQGAIIRIGDAPPVEGDIEIDLAASGWRAHGHDRNPAFGNVILRVVWEKPPGDQTPPLLHLRPLLDAPVEELCEWLPSAGVPTGVMGECCERLRDLETRQIEEILQEAALVRLESKAHAFAAGPRDDDGVPTLWPGLFAALGYKNNAWPMYRLGELAGDLRSDDSLTTQARILGVSGLLPRDLPESCRSTREYVRCVWNQWWRESEHFHGHTLPVSAWKRGGIRPANHPLRRMALAAHWLQGGPALLDRIRTWSRCGASTAESRESLHRLLSPSTGRDDYWECHWNFTSRPMSRPQPLLGRQRLADIAMNVVFPWLIAITSDEAERESIRRSCLKWPAGESNSRLRQATMRLFGSERRKLKRTAAIQQGMLQVENDFCNRSNAICDGCRFPEFVGRRR